MSEGFAVGIDLGTTNSCIAIYQEEKAIVIPNSRANRVTPSFVAFNDKIRLVGDDAKEQVAMNPTNTISNVKRLIGQKTSNPEVIADRKNMPFNVVSAAGDVPAIMVNHRNETKVFTPEYILSLILSYLKKTAEKYLGGLVQNAVITVPANFNDAQRQATKDAGRIAGFNVLAVLNEPTAAAIAYGFDKRKEGKKNVLIYDLGGGTFDVTILIMNNGKFDVKATKGDVHLGGEDFDNKLVDYCEREIVFQHNKCVKDDPRALRRLRTACETAKRNLSFENEATINIESLFDGIDYETKLNSARFEQISAELFERTLKTVEEALKAARMKKNEIDEVVLVGGSTRIPKIQKMLSDFFGGKKLSQAINPDEAVACGAAIHAAILFGEQSEVLKGIKLQDIAPFSLGIATNGGKMSTFIKKYSKLPIRKVDILTTTVDDQTIVPIDIYEGEKKKSSENNLLGKFQLKGIKPVPKGDAKIEITFDMDANGILNVSAIDLSSGNKEHITITKEQGRLTEDDIERMIDDFNNYENYVVDLNNRTRARNNLENLIYDVQGRLRDAETRKVPVPSKKKSEQILNETSEWVKENPDATKEESDARFDKLNKTFTTLRKKLGPF